MPCFYQASRQSSRLPETRPVSPPRLGGAWFRSILIQRYLVQLVAEAVETWPVSHFASGGMSQLSSRMRLDVATKPESY